MIRAGLPPDRIRDVVVVVPPASGEPGLERRALERLTAADRARAERTSGRPAQVFVLAPFDAIDVPGDRAFAIAGDGREPAPVPTDPLEPASAAAIALSSVLALLLVSVVGFGWARIAAPDAVTAAALAPAAGAAALVLAGIAFERLGVAIGSGAGGWAVSAVAGGGGYLVWRVLERRPGARPAPQVQE